MPVNSVTCKLMGSVFELKIIDEDQKKATENLQLGINEIKRLENLLTEFDDTSYTSLINLNAGKSAVKVPEEVFQIIQRSNDLSSLTNGYFDISVGPLKKIYQFKNEVFEMPSKKNIIRTLQKVGYPYIELNSNEQTIFLKRTEMHISFAAIGKGYAADAVKQLWKKNGINSGYINASGDLTAFGHNENNKLWNVGIANPDNQESVLFYVPLNNASVATSGDYEQHFIYNNTRYSHNINPKTGTPIKGIKSVSVFSPSAELSDALATAVYAMGTKKGIDFINQLPQTHTIIIDEKNTINFSQDLQYESIS